MFSKVDQGKKDVFVSQSKAARDQRNLDRLREKAAVTIQVMIAFCKSWKLKDRDLETKCIALLQSAEVYIV